MPVAETASLSSVGISAVTVRWAVLATSIVGAVALVVGAPTVVFFAAPLALGLPHLVNDFRFAVFRPRLPKRFVAMTLGFCAGLISLRVVEVMHLTAWPFARLELIAASGWVLAAAAWAGARRRLAPIAALALIACVWPDTARVVVITGHNLVALLLWAKLTRTRAAPALFVTGAVILIACCIAVFGGAHLAGLDFDGLARTFVPDAPPTVARGLLRAMLFLQLVHYAVWLVWVPRDAPGSPTFAAWPMLVAVAASVLLLALSIGHFAEARTTYLSVATFHAYLELAVAAFLFTRERR